MIALYPVKWCTIAILSPILGQGNSHAQTPPLLLSTGAPAVDKNNCMVWTAPDSLETSSAYLVKILDSVDAVLYGRATCESLGSAWCASRRETGFYT
jgi:hypothetical protein